MANPNIVNVTSIYGGNAGWNLTATTTTTLLTVAADVIVKVNAITCANVAGANAASLNLYIEGVGTTVTGVTGTGLATAIYLAKLLTSKSLPEISRSFSNRDHTTVIHSVKTIERLRQDDKELNFNIDNLKNIGFILILNNLYRHS